MKHAEELGNNIFRVLIVDDQEIGIKILSNILNDYTTLTASNGRLAIDLARQHRPDIILLDVMMPEMDGIETCRLFKADFRTSHIPVIFVTAQTDPDDVVAGFEVGAVDFISKPLNTAVVRARVATHLKLQSLERELRELAFYDPLTGLPNRRLMLDRLESLLARSSRHQQHGAVMFIDLNDFKKLNDIYGHDIGDLYLTKVAERLVAGVRASDVVSRIGGDEFVVLIEDLDPNPELAKQQADEVSKKIAASLSLEFNLSGLSYFGSASFGTKIFMGNNNTVKGILKEADAAMYRAKKAASI